MTTALVFLGMMLLISLVGGWLMSNVIIRPDVANYNQCYIDELALGGTSKEKFEEQYEKTNY